MEKKNVNTGITSEVYTIKSKTKLINIFNKIIEKKSKATLNWILNLNPDKNTKIIIVGTYFTGIGIVKELSSYFNNITLIDIYPHLKEFINSPIGKNINENYKNNIKFSTDLNLIDSGDIIIDTTGFGGLKPKNYKVEAFLIEDPIAEDNDILLKNKNNIYERLRSVNSKNKAILKTEGLNTKTSGTMTLTIEILRNAINESLNNPGVLYSACEMTFFEEIIFKEENIEKFLDISNKEAMNVSTIKPFNCDEIIHEEIKKINSKTIKCY